MRGATARAVAATTRAAAALGVGLASVLNVLDVPVVVLGGTYARLAAHVGPALRAELARSLAPAPARLLASGHGDTAAVRGAAESVLDAVQRDARPPAGLNGADQGLAGAASSFASPVRHDA